MILLSGLEKISILKGYSQMMISWLVALKRQSTFFKVAILPELLVKFFSRLFIPDSNIVVPSQSSTGSVDQTESRDDMDQNSSSNQVYYYCQGPESGDMIGCDNVLCPYQWFHFECLQLDAPPRKKTWYCPDCRKLQKEKKKRTD